MRKTIGSIPIPGTKIMADIDHDVPIRDMDVLLEMLEAILITLKEIKDRLPEKNTGG